MKKLLFLLLSVAALSASCKKDADVLPGGHVDGQAVGKWMYGSFSMSDFWSYDGRHLGKPFELAVVFDFKENGTYEKYFVAATRDYAGCRTETLSYEKGSVNFDEAAGSFTVTPAEGRYRGFYSCLSGKNIDRPMERSELQPQTYYYELKTGSNRQPNLVVRFNPGDASTSTFLPASW